MKKTALAFCSAGLVSLACTLPVYANSLIISDAIQAVPGGSNFDTWKFNIQAPGTFTVDTLAYEANAAGVTSDLNGSGNLTFMDVDTQWWRDDGSLDSSDAIIRCDDVANNCPKYAGSSSLNSSTPVSGLPISVQSHDLSEASLDGSLHKRDPWFETTVNTPGNYLLLVGQYTLNYNEVLSGVNTQTFSTTNTSVTDHADYQLILSSDSLNFTRNGNIITVSAVPLPGAVWLFGSALLGFVGVRRARS